MSPPDEAVAPAAVFDDSTIATVPESKAFKICRRDAERAA
jgi:hypothetical protein